ncbi:MAG: toll/interleukin-1 receptor domain-containing protein [Leptolyngbyaceae cyanobacterium SM1_4_3]|nr:toll/interleukin-1 receptor domain-containing protein [Leptolyngbyaceae cyanobacterium SM1_4_3]
MSHSSDAIAIFFSYAHEDEALRDELAKHLRTLERQGIIQAWHDRKIVPGSEWRSEIEQQLNAAQIILLLISPDFMNSDFCWSVELERAIERHNAQEACVIPIILRSVDWQDSPFGRLQALPKDANPVTKWSDRDEAFSNIAQGIKMAVKTLKENALPTPAPLPVVKLWIHGWKYRSYSGSPNAELDWTSYFDIEAKPHRKIATPETWKSKLLPQLKQVRDHLTAKQTNLAIDLQGLLPLSAALAVGNMFQDTAGYTLQTTQRTVGQDQLWRSSAPASKLKFKITEEQLTPGDDLLLVIAISGSSRQEMATFYANQQFNTIVYVEPETGTGEQALRSDADAIALVLHAKELMRHYRDSSRASCTHLVLYAPMGFCLFLGNRLRLVGDVLAYERVSYGVYQPSVELQTG